MLSGKASSGVCYCFSIIFLVPIMKLLNGAQLHNLPRHNLCIRWTTKCKFLRQKRVRGKNLNNRFNWTFSHCFWHDNSRKEERTGSKRICINLIKSDFELSISERFNISNHLIHKFLFASPIAFAVICICNKTPSKEYPARVFLPFSVNKL